MTTGTRYLLRAFKTSALIFLFAFSSLCSPNVAHAALLPPHNPIQRPASSVNSPSKGLANFTSTMKTLSNLTTSLQERGFRSGNQTRPTPTLRDIVSDLRNKFGSMLVHRAANKRTSPSIESVYRRFVLREKARPASANWTSTAIRQVSRYASKLFGMKSIMTRPRLPDRVGVLRESDEKHPDVADVVSSQQDDEHLQNRDDFHRRTEANSARMPFSERNKPPSLESTKDGLRSPIRADQEASEEVTGSGESWKHIEHDHGNQNAPNDQYSRQQETDVATSDRPSMVTKDLEFGSQQNKVKGDEVLRKNLEQSEAALVTGEEPSKSESQQTETPQAPSYTYAQKIETEITDSIETSDLPQMREQGESLSSLSSQIYRTDQRPDGPSRENVHTAKYKGSPLGMTGGQNATQLSLMVYKIAKDERVSSMAAAPCRDVMHWMPHVVERLELEVPGFQFYCVGTDETSEGIKELRKAYGEITGDYVEGNPNEIESAIPKDIDMVVSWMGIQRWGPKKTWRFLKGLRRSGVRMALLSNNPNSDNPDQPCETLNVRKAPFLFSEPSRIIGKVSRNDATQLLLYSMDGLRDDM